MKQIRKYKTVRGLFSKADRWIKGYYAGIRNGEFREIDYSDPDANCFCLEGALRRVYPDSYRFAEDRLLCAVRKLFPGRGYSDKSRIDGVDITIFNDSRRTTFEDIRKVVKEARV